MNDRYVLICILVSAAATLFMRALPFTILGKRKQIPEKIRYLGRILPAAIMAVLIVYCLKEVPTEFLSGGYKKLIAAAVCRPSCVEKEYICQHHRQYDCVYVIMSNDTEKKGCRTNHLVRQPFFIVSVVTKLLYFI